MKLRHWGLLGVVLSMAACSSTAPRTTVGPDQTALGVYKLGRPYEINGRVYVPKFEPDYAAVGIASWYGDYFHGRATANGETFDKDQISAAHPTLPLPSLVRVTNLDNNRELVLRVNDRGPFVGDRLIDLSQAAARELGYEQQGLARVKVEFIQLAEARGTKPVSGSFAGLRPSDAKMPEPKASDVRVADGRSGDTRAGAAKPYGGFTGERIEVAKLEPTALTPGARTAQTLSDAVPGPTCPIGPQWVQVGAFREQARVRTALNDLEDVHNVKIDPVTVNGQPAMRVRLGPMVNRATAANVLGEVRRLGYTGAFLATVDGNAQLRRC